MIEVFKSLLKQNQLIKNSRLNISISSINFDNLETSLNEIEQKINKLHKKDNIRILINKMRKSKIEISDRTNIDALKSSIIIDFKSRDNLIKNKNSEIDRLKKLIPRYSKYGY